MLKNLKANSCCLNSTEDSAPAKLVEPSTEGNTSARGLFLAKHDFVVHIIMISLTGSKFQFLLFLMYDLRFQK